MSDNVNPLYVARFFFAYSSDPRIAWEEEQQRARIMDDQRVSILAGVGNLSLIRNPLRRPPDYQGESFSNPSPVKSLVEYPHCRPANDFPDHPTSGYPSADYSSPGHPILGHPTLDFPAYDHGHAPAYVYATAAYAASTTPVDPAIPASPNYSPPVYHYIRPVIKADAEEIAHIINYHGAISPFNPEFEPLEPRHIRNIIENSKLRKLPFVVLVKPLDSSQTSQKPPKTQICGISYVDVFEEKITERSCGNLRVYIRPGMTRQGYGSLLVDCILSICDEYYRRRYQFEWRPVGDVQLQVQRLRELICIIPYPAQLELNYWFIWQWLRNTFGFMKHSEARQDRAKYGYE
ncbi:hypothetical protein F1880_006171 [Penicillium rolfsii]|nr:hypothetical protein F1880_006171 [Penicillium rolfsii]